MIEYYLFECYLFKCHEIKNYLSEQIVMCSNDKRVDIQKFQFIFVMHDLILSLGLHKFIQVLVKKFKMKQKLT